MSTSQVQESEQTPSALRQLILASGYQSTTLCTYEVTPFAVIFAGDIRTSKYCMLRVDQHLLNLLLSPSNDNNFQKGIWSLADTHQSEETTSNLHVDAHLIVR